MHPFAAVADNLQPPAGELGDVIRDSLKRAWRPQLTVEIRQATGISEGLENWLIQNLVSPTAGRVLKPV